MQGASSAQALLERLQGVRRTGEGRWIARCPGHEDRSPSLSIRELQDGRVLVHDFAGCSVEQVLHAIDMDLSSLFPPRPIEHAPRRPPQDRFPAADVLRALVDELAVVVLLVGDVVEGRPVSPKDFDRLRLARDRVEAARRLALGER